MDVSAIIVNWNTRQMLDDCLASLTDDLNDLKSEIIVVDNASTDGSAEMVAEKYSNVRLIANDFNSGFAGGNNLAYRISSGRYVLLLNPDTVVLSGAIPKLVDALDSNRDCAIAAPKLLWADRSPQASLALFPSLSTELLYAVGLNRIMKKSKRFDCHIPQDDVPIDFDWARGACLLVRREALERTDVILDERFFMFSEETDLCKNLRSSGWKNIYIPESLIVHIGSGSTSKIPEEMLAQLHASKYLYYCKNHGKTYANIYRFGVIPLHCGLRILGFLPSIFKRGDDFKRRQTHPAAQFRVLRQILKWGAARNGKCR